MRGQLGRATGQAGAAGFCSIASRDPGHAGALLGSGAAAGPRHVILAQAPEHLHQRGRIAAASCGQAVAAAVNDNASHPHAQLTASRNKPQNKCAEAAHGEHEALQAVCHDLRLQAAARHNKHGEGRHRPSHHWGWKNRTWRIRTSSRLSRPSCCCMRLSTAVQAVPPPSR